MCIYTHNLFFFLYDQKNLHIYVNHWWGGESKKKK